MQQDIRYITRNNLDSQKYDACIGNAINSRIYAYSWYLDIVADDWDVLVLGDYQAVMPLPKRRKYFIRYVYTPFWVAELGVFFSKELITDDYKEVFDYFIEKLKNKFSQIDILLNTMYVEKDTSFSIKSSQILSLSKEYFLIFKKYKKGRKSDISKARRNYLQIRWNDEIKNLIDLHKENVGNRLKYFKDRDYAVLEKLIKEIINHKIGEIVSAYDNQNNLLASTFIINKDAVITGLVTASDINYRNNGVTSFLYDEIIKKYSGMNYYFDFAGSSVESIAEFFRSFGAKDVNRYHLFQYHFLYRFLKKRKSI